MSTDLATNSSHRYFFARHCLASAAVRSHLGYLLFDDGCTEIHERSVGFQLGSGRLAGQLTVRGAASNGHSIWCPLRLYEISQLDFSIMGATIERYNL